MGPLHGIRILEFDAIGPVPFAAMLLADMGADVLRLARPGGQPAFEDLGEGIVHRGRPVVALDLKQPADRDAALDLVAAADAVIEGFRPGVMERLGLGLEVCLARNPRLVFARMTGWGQTGPLALRAGHDINYIALSGALGAMGEPGRAPVPPLNLVGDYGGGAMFLVQGVLAALLCAQRTGRGQAVDVAMTDGVALLLSMFLAMRQTGTWSDARGENLLDGGAPFYRCYACADGGHVAVGALEPQFFAALIEGLCFAPQDFVQYDRAGWPAMQAAFAARFATRSRDEWAAVFAGTDACVSPVLGLMEAPDHPQNAARGAHQQVDGLTHPAPAPRFGVTPALIRPAGPMSLSEALQRWAAASA